jgi:peptidoglycan/xylan/chitin deacetylase (PgdA/CDA1 family)
MTFGRALTVGRILRIALAAILVALAPVACARPSPTAAPRPTPAPTLVPTPAATARPTNTPAPTATVTATPVPALTWDQLKNAAYPNEWPGSKVAQLVDGVYREKYLPDSATEMVISLADVRTYGDLNADGAEDALVVLVSHPGGSGTFNYLAAVLNEGGAPSPVGSAFLGDRVILRSITVDAGQITVQMVVQGPDDPMCCPNMDRQQVYILQDDALTLLEQTDTPRSEPTIPQDVDLERIALEGGSTSAILQGNLSALGDKRYVIHGYAGQTLSLTVTSPHGQVFLSCYGSDGAVLVSIVDEVTAWTGTVPRALDYFVTLVSTAGDEVPYSLHLELAGEVPATPQPTPTSAASNGPDKVVYLTFDDGPVDPHWTPQVLDVLASFDAKATFFTLGQLALRYPDLIRTEAEAGHTVANHTFDHHTLDGIGREAFFKEVEDAQAALGEYGTRCLRPPYGAMDAYTRTYAAELGYTVALWNVDTEDWRRPGAEAIAEEALENARPGAIVLMHDGGGDREQTVAALRIILETLSSQGYSFQVVCR